MKFALHYPCLDTLKSLNDLYSYVQFLSRQKLSWMTMQILEDAYETKTKNIHHIQVKFSLVKSNWYKNRNTHYGIYMNVCTLKVRYSQKNIGDIFIAKQICCFTILNFVIWIFPPEWSVHSWHFLEACNPAKLFLLLELSTKDRTNVVSNQKR